MTYESLDQALEALRKHHQTMYAYHHALNAIHQDAATVAPKNTSEGRAKAMEILSGVTYNLIADPANGDLLNFLEAHNDELDDITPEDELSLLYHIIIWSQREAVSDNQ